MARFVGRRCPIVIPGEGQIKGFHLHDSCLVFYSGSMSVYGTSVSKGTIVQSRLSVICCLIQPLGR